MLFSVKKGFFSHDCEKPWPKAIKHIIAAVIELMDSTGIRIGNEFYAKTNHSFGASTLRKKHLILKDKEVRFEFIGKSGIFKKVNIEDAELAEVIKECVEIPGYDIFKYFDEDGLKQKVDSDEVNQYLREITGKDFTSKDFRTWAGTVSAFEIFCEEEVDEEKMRTKQLPSLVKRVAEKLANTPSVCRQHYIHPAIIDKYLCGEIYEFSRIRRRRKAFQNLTKEEISVITILEKLKEEIEMQN
jgi:DNA topoisomerase-1